MIPNWYVITGGPSTGKTTVIDELKRRGYNTTIEEARHYIDIEQSQGISSDVARENNRLFQENILTLQIALEKSLNPSVLTFLDRALPDELAYYKYLGLEPDRKLTEALKVARYKKVFLLDLLPLHHDYARNEDTQAQRALHQLIIDVYKNRPEPLISVPVLSPGERVNFILSHLE